MSSREGLPGITAPDGLPAGPGAPDAAGRLLGRITVLPALLTLPFLLISFPLLLLGWFKPAPVIVLWLLLAAVIVPLGWRWIPAPPDGSQTAGQGLPGADGGRRAPWWAIAALLATMRAWQVLLAGLGSPLRTPVAARILFLGQLGKYLPGSVWPILAQMELGSAYRVPRHRSASASVLTMLLSLLTALVTLPFVAGSTRTCGRSSPPRCWSPACTRGCLTR